MPAPLVIGAWMLGAGAVGYIAEWKLGRWLFAEEVEPNVSNLKDKYILQLKLLEYSLSDAFIDKKIYAYYLYSIIVSQQEILFNLQTQLKTNEYIEYIQSTLPEWETAILDISLDVENTLARYLSYESLFKKIFEIPYDERNFDKISEKIIPFDMLSEIQANKLITWIINPLFNGWFDFEMKDIPVIACQTIMNNNCKKLVIKEFPLPQFLADENNKHNNGPFDCIRPWVLLDLVISKKTLAKGFMDSWMGVIDSSIRKFTGINAGYTIKGGKAADELAGTAADFYDNMRKEFRSFRNSLSSAYSNTAAGLSGFTEAITIAGIGAAALVVYNLFQSTTSSNNGVK